MRSRWSGIQQQYTDKSMTDLILTDNKNIFRYIKDLPSFSYNSDHRLAFEKLKIIKPKLLRRNRKRHFVEKIKKTGINKEYESQKGDLGDN